MRMKDGKKKLAKIVRELEAAGHKVTNLSKRGAKSIGFVGGVPVAEVQVQEKRAGRSPIPQSVTSQIDKRECSNRVSLLKDSLRLSGSQPIEMYSPGVSHESRGNCDCIEAIRRPHDQGIG